MPFASMSKLMDAIQPFRYRNHELFCENVPLSTIAREVGTPCYVYSRNAIVQNLSAFRSAFEPVDPGIFFAVKANSNLTILRILHEEGCGFDVVSGGEIYRVRKVGAPPDRIVFSGVGKSIPEIEMALDPPILSINVESIDELETLRRIARDRRGEVRVSFRINPDVDVETHPYIATGLRQHKFGIDLDQAGRIHELMRQSPWLEFTGLGFHIGSQILDVQPFLDAFTRLRKLADTFRSAGFPIRHLDLGGGIGIPYKGEAPANLRRYAAFLQENRGDYRLLFEPGRLIVGDAGILLNQVLYDKTNHGKHFTIVDGAMNDLMRPSLYQAHHEVLAVTQSDKVAMTDVVGPICESGDFFARNRELPLFRQGDLLAVMNAGAYGFTLSSNYNARPRAPEILVEEDRYRIIRRRETLEDLIAPEC